MKGVSQVSLNDQYTQVNEQVVIDITEACEEVSSQEVKVTQVTQHLLATIEKDTATVDVVSETIIKIGKRKREEEASATSEPGQAVPESEEPELKIAKKEILSVSAEQKKDVLDLFYSWCDKLYPTLSWLQIPLYYVLKGKFETKVSACHDWDHLAETLNKSYQVIEGHKNQLSENGQKLLPELKEKITGFISLYNHN